jgi:predicted DNA-binding transcriptional regulator AlpA
MLKKVASSTWERDAYTNPKGTARPQATLAPSAKQPSHLPLKRRTTLAPNRQAQRQGHMVPPGIKSDRSSTVMARATPADAIAAEVNPNEKLTVNELCAELKISRSTFYDWRQKRRGPRCIRLPNGNLRIRRCDLDVWLATKEVI